jgi:transcriptional regulator with XRE-family HTH domain
VTVDVVPDKEVARAIDEELRYAREARGWSRGQVVAQLPSGIGDRTLLSYEHGTRHCTALRLIEICKVLEVDPPVLLRRGLQRARIYLDSIALRVDLKALVNDQSEKFRPMVQWARNTLNDTPSGVVEVEPAVVKNLALFVGCNYNELAAYLARFLPDYEDSGGETADGKITGKNAANGELP